MELPQGITETHRRRLEWFEEHKGEILPLAEMSVDGMRVAIKPKGIYKPADLDYSLSIRMRLRSEYDDGGIVPSPVGWTLRYFQEGHDPAERDRLTGNRGLMRCIQDRVPVGVVLEVNTAGRQTRYEVLGLATVDGWAADGYFELASFPAAPAVDAQEAAVQAEFDRQTEQDVPADDYDARRRALRQIVARRGQSEFRRALIEAYQGRCAITKCDAVAALEAAHLRPYRGPESNTVSNGLLLRADIHTLFDLGLLAIDPDTRAVATSKRLAGTQYEAISGRKVADPAISSQRPPRVVFDVMWHSFQESEEKHGES